MPSALIGIGSNIEPLKWLGFAAKRLKARFGEVRFSSVYRSPAYGMQGPDFLNACAWIAHAPPQRELIAWLKLVEDDAGRERRGGSWQPRTLDLDLLAYDGKVLDDELFMRAYLWLPAIELWPELARYCSNIDDQNIQRVEAIHLEAIL